MPHQHDCFTSCRDLGMAFFGHHTALWSVCRATPEGDTVAHSLEELLATWEAKDTVCLETGKELITGKLRELVARTAELAREGHFEA
jgi:hypothetical protein